MAQAQRMLHDFSPQNLSNTAWALATLKDSLGVKEQSLVGCGSPGAGVWVGWLGWVGVGHRDGGGLLVAGMPRILEAPSCTHAPPLLHLGVLSFYITCAASHIPPRISHISPSLPLQHTVPRG